MRFACKKLFAKSLVAAFVLATSIGMSTDAYARHKHVPKTSQELAAIQTTVIDAFEVCVRNIGSYNATKSAMNAFAKERGFKMKGASKSRKNVRVGKDKIDSGFSFFSWSKSFGPSDGFYQCGVIIENIDRDAFYDALRSKVDPLFSGSMRYVPAAPRRSDQVAAFDVTGTNLKQARIEISVFENHYGNATKVSLLWK